MSSDPVDPLRDSESAGGGQDMVVEVPDDARELARDVKAWRREVRWGRRRDRLERWTGRDLRRRDMRGREISGLVVMGIVLVVGLIGVTLVVFTPHSVRRVTPPTKLALAAPTQPAGTIGGLLPDVDLTTSHATVIHARDLRPTIIALVPANCRCAAAVRELVSQVVAVGFGPVDLVSTASQATQLADLAGAVGTREVVQLRDLQGELIDAFAPTGLTVVAVHSDGVIGRVLPAFGVQSSVEEILTRLGQPGFDQITADTTSP